MIITVTSVFLSSGVWADIEITEVELNPEGDDSGNEWIELYSDEEIDLEGYYLENEDGDIYNLSGEIDGYLVIEFDSQWLDNSETRVTLYDDSDDEVHDTDSLDDSENNDNTWQLCDGDWEFWDETKDEENDECDEEEEEDSDEEEEDEPKIDRSRFFDVPQDNLEKIQVSDKQTTLAESEKKEKIILGNPAPSKENAAESSIEDKSSFISKKEKLRMGVFYSFIGFIVLLVILLAWRKL